MRIVCWMTTSTAPGISRKLPDQFADILVIGIDVGPLTCTSIGAGAPKLRILAVKSDG